MAKKTGMKLIADNKKAFHDYLSRTLMRPALHWQEPR